VSPSTAGKIVSIRFFILMTIACLPAEIAYHLRRRGFESGVQQMSLAKTPSPGCTIDRWHYLIPRAGKRGRRKRRQAGKRGNKKQKQKQKSEKQKAAQQG
jgi:hypothetical protein